MEAPKAVVNVVRSLGPGHALAAMALVIIGGAGWMLLGKFDRDHAVQTAALHANTMAITAAAQHNARYDGLMLGAIHDLTAMMTAVCYSISNGDSESRLFCDEALVESRRRVAQ